MGVITQQFANETQKGELTLLKSRGGRVEPLRLSLDAVPNPAVQGITGGIFCNYQPLRGHPQRI